MPETQDRNPLPLYPGVDLQSSNSVGNISSNTPETGAPVSVINDFLTNFKNPYKVALQTNNPAATPLYPTLRYTSDALGYDYRDANIEYKYGDKYPVLSFFNNMGKFGANFVGAFAQGIATIPFAIKAIKDGDPEVFFNNEMTNGIQKWVEDLETSMPSYKTEYQDNHTFASAFNPFQLKAFTGTWGDVLKNLGFTAGAIGSALVEDAAIGLLTEGVGAAPVIGMQLAKLGRWASTLGKGVQGFNEAKSSIALARNAVNAASALKNVTSRIGYGTKLLTASLAEGAIEANQTYRGLKDNLRQHFIDKYGYEPSGQELDKIDDYAIQGGNANLLANTALLTLTNAITFDGLLKGRALTRLTLEKELANKTAIERTTIDNFALKTKIDPFKNFGEKIGYYSTKYGGKLVRPAAEAFEEGSQFMSDKTIQDYIMKRYDTENMTYTDNMSQSLAYGLKQTFLTKDGQYNMFLGALSGGISNVLISKIQKQFGFEPTKAQMSAQTQAMVSLLNNNTLTGLFRHTYNEASTSVGLLQDLKTANDKGDIFTFKNLQKQNFFNFISSGVKTNRFDLRIEQLNDLKTLNPQQFTELTEAEFNDENQGEFNQYVDNLISEAESMKKSVEKVNKVFVNKFDPKKNSEEYNIFEDYKDALAYSVVLTDDSLSRINKLGNDVTTALPGIDINKAVNLVNFKGVRQTVNDFESRLAELKATKEGLDTKSKLYEDINAEINFLEGVSKTLNNTLTYNEAIENLQPLMDKNGRVTERPIENNKLLSFERNIDYERDLGRILEYYSKGTVTDTVQRSNFDAVDRTSMIRSLQDIFKLDIQGRTANKYYNILATNKGYNRFKQQVKNRLKQYASRIDIDDQGNFTYKTDQQLQAEKEALITAVAKMQEDLRKQTNIALEEEPATNEEVKTIETVVAKEAKGQDLTPEEEKVKAEKPNVYTNKTVARKKAEEANLDLMNELNIVDPDTLEDDTKIETEDEAERPDPVKEQKVPIQSQADTKYQGVNPYSILGRIFGNHLVVKDQDGIALQNVFNLIFKIPLNEAVKTLSQNIKFVVKESTSGTPSGKFVEIRHENTGKKVYENLVRQGYGYEVQVYNGDQFLGILTLGNSLFYKNSKGETIPVSQISKDEYQRATIKNYPDGTKRASNDISTYDEFISLAKAYEAAANSITEAFKNGKEEFNSQDVANIFSKIKMWQGVVDIQSKPTDDSKTGGTLLSDLEYLPDNSVILTIPYADDKRSNVSQIQIIDRNGIMTDVPSNLYTFLSDNIDKIQRIDQRYVLILPTPDGNYYSNFSIIGLRHASVQDGNLGDIFKSITKDSKTKANNTLDQIYINLKSGTENQAGISVKFKKTRDFGINIHINDKNSKARETVTITEKVLKSFNSMDDLLAYLNDNSDILLKYETGVYSQDIKAKNINFSNTDFEYLSQNLIAAVSPQVAKDFYVFFVPETSNTNIQQQPIESTVKSTEEESTIREAINSGVLKGMDKTVAEMALKGDINTYLETIADQALNKISGNATSAKDSMDRAVTTYGKSLVDLAVKKFGTIQNTDVIPEVEFNDFVNSGKVSYNRLDLIANKIVANTELSIREQAILGAKTAEINNIIVQIHATNSKVNSPIQPTVVKPVVVKQEVVKPFSDVIAKVTNKKQLVSALQSVFTLPNNQAEAVTKIYDAAAQGMVNLGIYKTKEEYYKNTPLFIKPSPDTNFQTSDKLLQGEEPLIRSLLEVGQTFDTEITARERFNIPALKKIGSGSDRDVYDIGDGKVVKIAKTARGLEQNIHENDTVLIEQGVLPQIYETGLNYVVVENVEPATSKNSKIIEFLNAFKHIDNQMASITDNEEVYGIFDRIAPLLKQFGISDSVLSYELMWGDFRKQANWGVRDGQLVHIDGGTFAGNNLIHQYKGKTNLEDADFKEIYQRSKELKSQFKDRDKNTMYQSAPIGQVIGNVVKGFELNQVDGFNMSFKTKNGVATPALARRINQWLQENGYDNVMFTYESTYGTLNPLYKEYTTQGKLFQKNKGNYKSKQEVIDERNKEINTALYTEIGAYLNSKADSMDNYDTTLAELYRDDITPSYILNSDPSNIVQALEKLSEDYMIDSYKLYVLLNFITKNSNIRKTLGKNFIKKIDSLNLDSMMKKDLLDNDVIPFKDIYGNITYDIQDTPTIMDTSSDISMGKRKRKKYIRLLESNKLNTNLIDNIYDYFIYPATLNQNAKGAIDLNERIIYALTSPDVSTPLHEFAHLWLNDIENAARTGNAQAQNILDIFENFSNSDEAKVFFQKHFGSKEFDPADFKFRHELFARGFERYIVDNQAPKSTLEQIFEMFKQWLIDIYNGITGSDIDIQLNDKMKEVYDQILGKKITNQKSTKVAVVTEPSEPVSLEGKIETKVPITSNNSTTFENLNITLPSGFEGRVFSVPVSEVTYEEPNSKLTEREEDIIEGKGKINPVVLTLNPDGTVSVKEGAERLQAMKNVGYKNVPVIFENEDSVPFIKSSEKIEETPVVTEPEVKEESAHIVEPIKPINKVQVEAEAPKQFSMNEVAVQSTKKLIPFDKVTKESKGIKTFDTVEFKGKQYVVSNIDDEGFLSLVSSDIVVEKNDSLFYTKQPTRSDIQLALPEMVTPIVKVEKATNYKFDPVIRVAEKIQQIFPQIKFEFGNYNWNQAGRFENGKVKLNKNYFSNDTPIHEFLHPFILAVKTTNPQLYANLLADLQTPEGKATVKEIINDKTYADLTKSDILDEAIVRLMSKDIVDVFDNEGNINEEKLNEKRNSFIDSIKELFNYLMDLIFGRLKNTSLNNFINKMNADTSLSGKYLFKVAPLGTTRSKVDTVVLANKTVIYLNPKYFTETTIIDNLFYDIQQEISDEDYKELVKAATDNIKIVGSENKTNPVSEIKYKKSTNQVVIKKFSNTTGKIQQEKTRVLDSVEDLAQFITPDEYDYFIEHFNNSLGDIVTVEDINKHTVSAKENSFIKSLTVKDIPINLTIGQLSDFIITQNVKIDYTEGEMDAIAELTAFSSKTKNASPASDEVKAAIKRLQDRVRNLKDTGDRRIFNDRQGTTSVTKEANALQDILNNENEVTGLLEYIRQGIVSLEFAVQNMNVLRHDFYEKINSGNITSEDVNKFNREFKELSTYYTYYSNLSYLTGKFGDLFYDTQSKSAAKEELDRINTVLGRVELSKKNFQGLVTDMVTEWLFPYYYQQMNIIGERNKNLPSAISKKVDNVSYMTYGDNGFTINKEALKKHLRNQLIRSDEDASFATYLLGSTITSRDPINAVTSMVLTDAIYENDEFTDRLWVTLNIQYEQFLKDKGLPDNEKQLRQWYKDNYLRKALSYEKTGRNEDGTPKYEYIERYAYNEDKFYDLIEKDLRDFAKNLPKPTTAEEYTANRDKISDKRKELEASPLYVNPKYQELMKDEYYTILYKNHKYSNNFFGNNGLKFGIIGQVNSKKSPTQAIKEGVTSLKEKAQEIGQEKTIRGKVKNAVKSTVEYLFDDNEGIDNVQYNFDDSLYRNIRTSTLIPIDNEEDLELLLHENLMVFTKDGLKYSALRDIQSNIDNLKYLVQGNPALGINPRKAIALDKSGNKKWFNFIKLPKNKEDYQNRLNDQLIQNINDVVYGDSEKESYLSFGQTTDENGNKVGGVSISLNNVGKNLGFGTALLNMSGNLLAMSRNMTIGNVTNLMEAVGSRYTSSKDYGFATAEYSKQLLNANNGILADAFSRKKSKIAQMALLYDAIQGEYRDKEGRIITENFTRKYYSSSSWFLLNHAAEHQIQLTMMIALMKGKKVKTSTGGETTLWDAYSLDKNGLYTLSKDIQWSKEDTTAFRKEMHSILRELNGNYSELHKAVLQRSWWGKMLMMYRKYIYPQVRSRFGGFRLDYERGDVAYGYFRLFTKQLVQDIRELGVGQALQNIGKNLKNNDEKTYLNYATRKTVFELSTLTALLILIKALAPDDDDKEKISKLNAYALLWMNSLYSDLGSYTFQSFAEIGKQIKNPSASNITLTKVTALADQVVSDMVNGEVETYDQEGYGYKKGDSKLGTKFEKLIPISSQILRFQNPEQQLQFFSLIGKRVRTND